MKKRLARRHRAGTASIEIAVMLPVFIALFFGAFHMHRSAQSELAVRQEARACAWQFALSGCKRGQGEGLCASASTFYEGQADSQEDGVFSWIAGIPVFKQVVQFVFGEGMSAQATIETRGFMSSAKAEKSARTYLVCNTVSESWQKKVEEALCDTAKSVFPVRVPGC